ncbi:MAG: hypothetical protein M1820_002342 [Bogoriella megaspora]|nr:MAG: hypothetical protein M1820_002342 [Bogoriella megaspora]
MAADTNNPFIKQLASSDRQKRDAALESLRTYISRRTTFDEIELLKLWKGLFFCMWMSDGPKAQQQLARALAELVDILPANNAIPFLDAFWRTMAREWVGIDVLRMDKYLYLIRQYFAASLRFFEKRSWQDTDLLDEYMDILATTPLNTTDAKVPDGLRYHLLDIYVDEMDKIDADRRGLMPVQELLEPIRRLALESPTKAIRLQAKETLKDERILDWNGTQNNAGDGLSSKEDNETKNLENTVEGDGEWSGIED